MSVTRREFLHSTSAIAGAALIRASADFLLPSLLRAQTNVHELGDVLKLHLQTGDIVEFQLREYLMKRIAPTPCPRSAAEWTAEQKQLRKYLLDNVIFHGWPREWVDAPPKFEDVGLIHTGQGYRLRKLRYEIVPGFQAAALLYEPEAPNGKVPAILNLNGHTDHGKAAEYKQKRCINYALRGMYALSLEWLGFGELDNPENDHWNGAYLNLVGANATGLFYLATRKGLDYLCEHPCIDLRRIGATGLSGGGWQTIILSSLDERVAAAAPVSGYFSFASAIERNSSVGDMEYLPNDLFVKADYSTLTAMLAPRPILMMYGALDEYGMRAALEKPHLYDEIKPFFELYGEKDHLVWHQNLDPGTHNYQLDNRQQSYAFFAKHFNMPIIEAEIPVNGEVKKDSELYVGIAKDNLTITGLAKKMAAAIQHQPIPTGMASRREWADTARVRLADVIRYVPVSVKHAWPIYSTRFTNTEAIGYRLEFSNALSATAVWLKPTTASDNAPMTILLEDDGPPSILRASFNSVNLPAPPVSLENAILLHLNRGEQVLLVNLIFNGDASPDTPRNQPVHVPEIYMDVYSTPAQIPSVMEWLATRPPSALYSLLLSAAGDRPLGMQAAQLIGIADWIQRAGGARTVSLESIGIRNQVTALVAAALVPTYFSGLTIREGMKSFGDLIKNAVHYQDAPELFCMDLYKSFDIDILAALAEPTRVTQSLG